MPNMEAERLGLKEADQILSVNGTDFEDIEHAKAVKILKSHTHVAMKVRHFPYGYRKTYDKVENANVGILTWRPRMEGVTNGPRCRF